MRSRFVRAGSFVATFVLSSALASAQYRIGPVYPQNPNSPAPADGGQLRSGQDPFQYNPWTGRWDYVPIPYEADPFGSNYNPYRFNWYSGRYDYVPAPSPWNDNGGSQATGAGATWQDTRIDTGAIPANAQIGPSQPTEPPPVPGSRPVPAAVLIPPRPLAHPVPPPQPPATRPASQPSSLSGLDQPTDAPSATAPSAAVRDNVAAPERER